MKNIIKQNKYFGFWIALLFIGFVVVYSWFEIKSFVKIIERTKHSCNTLVSLKELASNLNDLQAEQRGFNITGNFIFLKTYDSILKNIQKNLSTLKNLTANNPKQSQRLNELIKTINKRIERTNSIIKLKKQGKSQVATKMVATGEGEMLADSRKKLIFEMENEERCLAICLEKSARASAARTVCVVFLGNFCALSMIIFTILMIMRKEKDLARVTKALKTLSESNQVLVRAKNEQGLLKDICRVIIEMGKYRFAWVGYAEKDSEKTIKPVSQYGHEDGYLNTISPTWAETAEGFNPAGTAIRECRPFICRDIANAPAAKTWREEGLKRGYASLISLPLISSEKAFGALTIYSSDPKTFDQEEVKLLVEMAGDLAFGIGNFRLHDKQKQLEEQFLQAQKMEAVGTLAGGIAHDFNNLLTAIKGYSSLVLNEMPKDDPKYKDIEEILKSANNAASLTSQLLAFSRKQMLQPYTLNLNSIITELEKMLKRLIGEDIELNIALEPNLLKVKVDPGQIQQVIMNIIVNARDSMPNGGKVVVKTENIEIGLSDTYSIPGANAGNYVRMSIEDTGHGMNEHTVQHIFDPFFTTKEIGKGTGLGLSVVYGIIQQHDGWINVYSEVGKGSTFRIYIPAVSDSTQVKEYKIKDNVDLKDLYGKGERILLVEDEPSIRLFTTRALTKNGYIVYEAADGEEALDIFEKESRKFDLVFSDMIMKGKTGLELVDHIISRNPDINILLTSGYLDDKSQLSNIQKRRFQFIQKPYNLSDLLTIIKRILENKI